MTYYPVSSTSGTGASTGGGAGTQQIVTSLPNTNSTNISSNLSTAGPGSALVGANCSPALPGPPPGSKTLSLHHHNALAAAAAQRASPMASDFGTAHRSQKIYL